MDDRKSSQLLQADYEALYLGPEFTLEARLAQIIAFIWVTFMFNHVLPLIIPIAMVNFFCMYWIDKLLLLRFYRIPKNFDEQGITYVVSMAKYAFIWHFALGFFALSNN